MNKRCYERYNHFYRTGTLSPINHCGSSYSINNIDYCSCNGKIDGYSCYCIDIHKLEEITLFDIINDIIDK